MLVNRTAAIGVLGLLFSGCGSSGTGSTPSTLGAQPNGAAVVDVPRTSWGYKVLHRFQATGFQNDGANPDAGLINVNGTLYGTTVAGGTDNEGTVFTITQAGMEQVLYSFHDVGGSDGSGPEASLINVNGTLYGTTAGGGSGKDGTVYSISTAGAEQLLYSFVGGADGQSPSGPLLNVNGTLYGTTSHGGVGPCSTFGCGTVFSTSTTGAEQVLHSFAGGEDGAFPVAGLTDVKGTLYGTTVQGGSSNTSGNGTAFNVSTTGSERVIFNFPNYDGQYPEAGLVDVKGVLYGTASGSGANGWGSIFGISTTGALQVLYSFQGGADGGYPEAGLVNVNGTLYGATYYGGVINGSNGWGTIFSFNPTTGAEQVIYSFTGGADGQHPQAGLVGVNGSLYGTTYTGGARKCNCGTVFKLYP